MNKFISNIKHVSILGIVIFCFQGCSFFSRTDLSEGELIGIQGREWDRKQTPPYGMTFVPPGTFHMGQADEDITSSKINMNRQITIGGFFMDDTEITNNEYRQFIDYMLESSDTSADWTAEDVIEELYPDTTVWTRDFSHHLGDPMTQYYFFHPAFDDYPVVGVDWFSVKEFCKWRSSYLNAYREEVGLFSLPNFRLPSEAEWEYAARGGLDMAKYPWGGPYIRNAKGCALANFKPGRGNYYDDGFQYTAPCGSYFANGFGLYDMTGNVAEWCEDAFHPASMAVIWDLNPIYFNENEPKKVVRGGSWKDIPFYTETGTRSYEYQDSARSYIGFRCAMTYLGRSSGDEF